MLTPKMNDNISYITEAEIYQSAADRMMPEDAKLRRAHDRARAAMAVPEFLLPEWAGLTSVKVMALREAAALACGINRRFAWVVEHRVGSGAARAAVEAAHELLRYLSAEHGVTPKADVPLKRVAEWARDANLPLPAGFPEAQAPAKTTADVMNESRTDREDRRLRELENEHHGTAELRNGKWRFTRIGELTAAEKARGAKAADEKSINADLKAACERRENANRERGSTTLRAGALRTPWSR